MTRKERTDAFNELEVPERKAYLESLSETDYKKFVNDIREQAVQDFWDNERKLILEYGKSTENWTPEQIERIMNFEDSGKKGFHAGKAMQLDANGNPLLDSHGKYISYEGHHMFNGLCSKYVLSINQHTNRTQEY